ncbi:Allo37 [Anguillid herpesvirus 1]|uniref:Protein Allo37 n=1 Tax=Anguillid herpesvirus 1 TaxID=150286 RepID=A0A8E5ANG6_9VIRU|nr:protein Allo37 [Anguillid herpesvirus 1]QRM17179.1 protein Allo37 [Anguillid herpesvirus 1]UTN00355.1 Allo37 [Anguillid herpesvirus 1]
MSHTTQSIAHQFLLGVMERERVKYARRLHKLKRNRIKAQQGLKPADKDHLIVALEAETTAMERTDPIILGPGNHYSKVLRTTQRDVVFACVFNKILTDVNLCDLINKALVNAVFLSDTASLEPVDWGTGLPPQTTKQDGDMAVLRITLAQLEQYITDSFKVYLTEFFRNYFLYQTVYSCIPYTFIKTTDVDLADPPQYTEIKHFDQTIAKIEQSLLAAIQAPSIDRRNLITGAFDLIEQMPQTIKTVLTELFEMLASITSKSFIQTSGMVRLICLMVRITDGYIPYIPPFENRITVAYDGVTKECGGVDDQLRIYRVFMLNTDPLASITNVAEALKVTEQFEIGFRNLTGTVFDSNRYLITGPKEGAEQQAHTETKNDVIKALFHSNDIMAAAEHLDVVDNSLLSKLKASSMPAVDGNVDRRALGQLVTKSILDAAGDRAKATVVKDYMFELKHKVDDAKVLIKVMGLVSNIPRQQHADRDRAVTAARTLIDTIVDEEFKQAAMHIFSSRVAGADGAVGGLRHIHLATPATNIQAFDTKVAVSDISELLGVWHGYWRMVLLSESLFSQRENIITYKGKGNKGVEADRLDSGSIKHTVDRVTQLLNTAGYIACVDAIKSVTIDEIHKYTLYLNPNSLAVLLSNASGLSISAFDTSLIRQFQFSAIGGQSLAKQSMNASSGFKSTQAPAKQAV